MLNERDLDGEDRVLGEKQRLRLLSVPVVVEEKLDGASVSIWFDGPDMQFATRGGVDAMDRGGILGRVRQWAYSHVEQLRVALGQEFVLYGEWLLIQHGVAYTRLPAPLVGFDVLDRSAVRFLGVDERDAVLANAAVPSPPRLFAGRLGSAAAAACLIRRSAFGDQDAEGIIIRPLEPDATTPRVAKLVRADFTQVRGLQAGASENVVISR